MTTTTSRAEVERLLNSELGKDYSYDGFRIAFEELYNFKLDRGQFSPAELAALEGLFDVVAWYSPLRRDRERVAQYRDEDDVRRALEHARQAFCLR